MTRAVGTSGSGLRSAFDAALIMAVGMGFGRFAFTAVYPHMVEEGLLTLHGGSLAASANYAGYLIGALLAMRMRAHDAHRLCVLSFVGTALCLAVLAAIESIPLIIFIRGVAGVFSALAMVGASLWLLAHRGQMHRAPLLYAGVGIGIALSAELLVVGAHAGLSSQGLWLMLGVVSLVIGLVAAPGLLSKAPPAAAAASAPAGPATVAVKPLPLIVIYGLAGFGYIITATYLPLLVKSALPDLDSAHVWAVFGIGAIGSCFVWHSAHQRLGTRIALTANLCVQAFGVVLPTLAPSAAGYLLSALLVGGTFTGTVTIAVPAAQRIAREGRGNLVAIMTVVYGVGQIVGPIVANTLFNTTHTFTSSLIAAGAALLVAAILSVRGL
ncbi:YbfB/YjiJ family MFS transporter [Schauerella aestuarii]|uniref:YbfB/YjiJ family MFS transporter n=1 Tax=Schauerella aestuarii TaxID=2511204 RepID=UPI001369D9B9|nr:YbfB/YjiJ family MFS transporter [Achromobacter aestuarii]MYZ41674.1 YbfB/YjiJ family MFS transporter [Achromobacter aestuarii]